MVEVISGLVLATSPPPGATRCITGGCLISVLSVHRLDLKRWIGEYPVISSSEYYPTKCVVPSSQGGVASSRVVAQKANGAGAGTLYVYFSLLVLDIFWCCVSLVGLIGSLGVHSCLEG